MAYWWLNQKEEDFALLDEEGVVAVPRRNKLGKTNPSYATVADMRPADIGFVFVGGDLDGVFTVVEPPEDDTVEMAPDFHRRPARLVAVSFYGLAVPVRTEETTLRLRNLLPAVDSPLDPNGASRDTSVHRVDDALAEQLIALAADAEPMSASIGEAMAEAISLGELPDETKAALAAARLGMGRFGEAATALWDGACCATGVTVDGMLHVCAIKPWVHASDDERLDAENGLPFVPTWDLAFSTGMIAFDHDGSVLLGADLPPDEARKAGIDPGFRLAVKGDRQRNYLAWHRAHVFVPG